MRGIILAGNDAHCQPATAAVAKSLLPVYDKPMIYYPLSALLLSGIRDILIIAPPPDIPRFQHLLGGGEQWGINLSYAFETPGERPGLPGALITGTEFIGNRPVALTLGNQLFYGRRLSAILQKAAAHKKGACVFASRMENPEHYAIVSFDNNGKATELHDPSQPAKSKSNHALAGLYFYDHKAAEYARALQPSPHNPPQITDLNRIYLDRNALRVCVLNRTITWRDINDPDSLLDAARRIKTAEARRNIKIGCPEEAAWRMGFINDEQLLELATAAGDNCYAHYLRQLPEECMLSEHTK